MTAATPVDAKDFGEVSLSEDGRLAVPDALLRMFHLSGGDLFRFEIDDKGKIVISPRKRRRIVDIARANAFKIGDAGRNLDALIDEAVTEAMVEQEERVRRASEP